MIRAVLDANIFVSALIRPQGKSDQILGQTPGRFLLLTSEFIISEVEGVLRRRHIQTKYGSQVTREKRAAYVREIRTFAEMVQVKRTLQVVSDPKDNPVLACAVDGEAEYLVTGDRHLLKLSQYEGVKIVTPEEFLQIIERL